MFETVILSGAIVASIACLVLQVKEGYDPYEAEKEYYKEHGEFPSYVYDIIARSGETEESFKEKIGL